MRVSSVRRRISYATAVLGGCLGVYVILAVAFHWLIEPSVSKSHAVAPYSPAAATIAQYSDGPIAAPDARSKAPTHALLKQPTSARDRGETEPAFAQASSELQTVTPSKRSSTKTTRRSACLPSYDSSGAQTGSCPVLR
jgi:hypothetical protein